MYLRRSSILLLFFSLFLSVNLRAHNLQAYFSYSTFGSSSKDPFIETYLLIAGSTTKYVSSGNNKYQSSIQVTFIFKQDTMIKFYNKYNLLSPELSDTVNINYNFIDQYRTSLPNGDYTLELIIKDNNNPTNAHTLQQPISLSYPTDELNISDIELLEKYTKTEQPGKITKSGYDMIPLISGFYPTGINSIKFYAEIYNTPAAFNSELFMITYYISSYETNKAIDNLQRHVKYKPDKVIPILSELPIENLPSGNYNLVLEVRNKKNEVLKSKKCFFQRSNKNIAAPGIASFSLTDSLNFVNHYSQEQIKEHTASLYPISTNMELNTSKNLLKTDDEIMLKQYFYNFWLKRNTVNPKLSWETYFIAVKKANEAYGTRIRKGYETDRGRIYLKNGPPNSITESKNEPSAYPYEIWHYHQVGNESNRKYVFYNPDLVSNDYILLHSDALGELHNDQWKLTLFNRSGQVTDYDELNEPKHFGGKVSDAFDE